MNNVLSCFFPTTVVLVDDSASFLNGLVEAITVPGVTFKRFTNPFEALEYINKVSADNRLNCANLAKEGEESTSDWKSMMININLLHKEIYSFNRFSKISTVVTDYSMPGITGAELCSGIKDQSIQKLMLTAIADEKMAIDAFNCGYINRFVKKGVESFELDVMDNIKKLLYQYFKIYTDDIAKHLSVSDQTHLNDPVFANFFFNTCLSGEYVEYYMLDTFGGYLFLDSNGKVSLLSVLTEHEINKIVEIGMESGEVSKTILDSLSSREYMLVSHNRSGQLPPLSEWENYLMPARRLEGYQTYYFSFAGAEFLDLDFDNIKSFDKFQEMSAA